MCCCVSAWVSPSWTPLGSVVVSSDYLQKMCRCLWRRALRFFLKWRVWRAAGHPSAYEMLNHSTPLFPGSMVWWLPLDLLAKPSSYVFFDKWREKQCCSRPEMLCDPKCCVKEGGEEEREGQRPSPICPWVSVKRSPHFYMWHTPIRVWTTIELRPSFHTQVHEPCTHSWSNMMSWMTQRRFRMSWKHMNVRARTRKEDK